MEERHGQDCENITMVIRTAVRNDLRDLIYYVVEDNLYIFVSRNWCERPKKNP